ncbi:MAG: hypothetical protein GYB68_09880 [Chloroflexi bacterium]|nr:hypothetical protein [Chloroflexota bacterium]
MGVQEKVWHMFIGDSWLGTLTPTGADDSWYYADFNAGDSWGNFAPWFEQAVAAHMSGDDAGWENVYSQLLTMGLILSSDDGEVLNGPTVHIDGSSAWFFA